LAQKHLLYVEDDARQREEVYEYFQRHGWKVDIAENGHEALTKLKSNHVIFNTMILDLRMPGISGEELLEVISDENIQAPPIIILSAHLADEAIDKCKYLGAVHILTKPYSALDLEKVASLVAEGVQITNIPNHFAASTIDYMVKRRETALKEYMKSIVGQDSLTCEADEPLFIVGRRWNSWYPSIFPVPGGAYAIVSPRSMNNAPYPENSRPTVVIDPGFRFLEIFRDIGVSLANIECCIATHNHPDHIGGIFEFLAARHAFGKRTRAFCNPAVSEMLGNCSNFNLEVKELNNEHVDALYPYPIAKDSWIKIRLKGFNTFHEEIGRLNSAKGLVFTLQTGNRNNDLEDISDVVIVGDTEYDHADHHDLIIPTICTSNVRLVVLHIGCSQLKQSTGKHLYLKGLEDILQDMDAQLRMIKYQGKLLVVISEWGLEHATKQQLLRACGTSQKGFNDISPIKETIELLQKSLKKIILLPADIGLMVGVKSGNVYLQDGSFLSKEEVRFDITDEGIVYRPNN
jgi:CheY-like chemotaxis protein